MNLKDQYEDWAKRTYRLIEVISIEPDKDYPETSLRITYYHIDGEVRGMTVFKPIRDKEM